MKMWNERVYINSLGETETLKAVTEPMEDIARNEVRVKVLAAGVAMAEILMKKGIYPGAPAIPFVPGYDIVGIVDEVGEHVTSYSKGQRVAALSVLGGYSRYITLQEDSLVPVPEKVDPYEAAAVILNYISAYQMLHRVAKVKSGDSILVHGAAGGVGKALLQLARLSDLHIFGTASYKNKQIVLDEGAIFIDYKHEDFVQRVLTETESGVDIVFDGIGGFNWSKSYQVLKREGIFVGYGLTALAVDGVSDEEKQFGQEEWTRILTTERTGTGHQAFIYSISKTSVNNRRNINEDMRKLFDLLADNRIRPEIAQRFPLRHAAKAHAFLEKGAQGKVLLIPNE
jgi:NADPH:quinone reductase-like Zn-dependent oxidoreductase